MKFGVVIFPGSNCDQDIIRVLEKETGEKPVELWHKDQNLKGCEFVVLPGGFSYGDYLRSGAIARFSPVMGEVIRHAEQGGYVMGICNGFQILTEAGLLPGTLQHNIGQKFICKNIFLKCTNTDSLVTNQFDSKKTYKIPIAHAEGRYYADEETLRKLHTEGSILFNYCDESGKITEEANPNGSSGNIAGIMNTKRNVFGMMPHPERASEENLGNTDGRALFQSVMAVVNRV